MAEAVLEIVLHNLSSLIHKEIALFLGFQQDFNTLSSLLTTIKATLDDAEEQQFSNRAIKDWLLKLKDAAHVLDDILDECATQVLELDHGGFQCGPSHKVLSSCLLSIHPKHVSFRYKIAKKMKRIRERLDEIAEERSKFHLTEIARERRSRVLDWRQTTSIISQPQVYGRNEDKDKIVDFLVDDAYALDDLSVYPIVGLGGLGKTTLAQIIFNHERVVNHFELRIWVCVSEDFSLKRMTKAIIESASGRACEDLDLEPLQRNLLDFLQRKRFLLVLDDVWDDEQENWQRLKSVLACGGKGASVLVTTHLPKVAATVGTMSSHDLSILSDNDCWELFKQRVFGPNEEEHAELVVIGKEIVKKCGGVPLAAIALGSLLRFKRDKKEWLYVKESKLWSLQGENSVMHALKLSYLNLPVNLRQCFAFCSLFPKDHIINKQYLIELWMANGFISSNVMVEAEDIGNEVCNELHWRSFFQDIVRDEFGKITAFKMHDLVHDLAQSVAEEVCCITNDDGVPNMCKRILHLSIYRNKSFEEVDNIRLRGIKSLKTCVTQFTDQVPPHILKSNLLRVLEFQRRNVLSSSIGHLKCLRYLNLSNGKFRTLPKSFCRLFHLQILKLNSCIFLQELPDNLTHLKALKHLYLRFCFSLSRLPPDIRKLTSLRTLSMYPVGKKSGFLLAELGQLNLKGDLHITHMERVKSVLHAREANMLSKHLNQLQLSWAENGESQSQDNVEQILEVLQPHLQELQILNVIGYTGAHFPQWMSSASLKFLNSLKLIGCKSCFHLPQLGKLPSLKNLTVSNMSRVIFIDEDSYGSGFTTGFIALELLILVDLPNLMRLSREDRENMFPRLSRLLVTECPKLLGLPFLPSLKDLNVEENCNQVLLNSFPKHHSLESLEVRDNKDLTCFPDGMLRNLTSLKMLAIDRFSKLEQLPTEIINLNAIYINDCGNLESLTDEVLQGFHSLKIFEIRRCKKFDLSAGFQYLTCLERLVIENCPEVKGFDEALQHMNSLQSLTLLNLPNLASLPDWIGNLSLLCELHMTGCPKLRFLPMNIQRLTNLKSLRIYDCSELGKRCEKEIGEDWPKISHIQNIEIKNGKM
ncbi:putative disease resistance protein RGA1 isoform X3 [Trifolium pratense]|uniref:putative disease resistance protein RGA1 isoform X3 n=1 Tax=Trifolium pratense TaxID=57577 RepID=UPI001E696ED6|nr:putative disease resistance protein RGA1 isoform X3 [Trifolium pratense]XP_045812734.1 putative disease resistance protein RGA1 isoform X3 [Trifolium pratense]